MPYPKRGARNNRSHSPNVRPDFAIVADWCLYGDDEDRLLALLTPKIATSTGLTAVSDDPAVATILATAAEHRRVAQEILDRSVPVNTMRSYATHIRARARWCRERNIPALPADSNQVVDFLTAYAVEFADGAARRTEQGGLIQAKAVSSLSVRASALHKIHQNAGLASPTDDPTVRDLLAGLRKLFHVRPRNAKGAIDQSMLQQLTAACRPQDGHLRRWAAILLHARVKATVADLRKLQWADIDLDDRTVTLSRRAATSSVALEAHPDSRLDLACVLGELRTMSSDLGLVFINDRGQPVARQSLHATLERGRRAVGPLTSARPSRLLTLYTEFVQAGEAKARRDVALLTAGWWAALRRSELSALNWRDLTRRPDGHWALLIRFSKTDQEGRGTTLYLPRVATDRLQVCPSRAMDAWHEHVCRVLGFDPMRRDSESKIPVFATVDRFGRMPQDVNGLARLSGHAINELIQSLVGAAGIEANRDGRQLYGGHSLRAGFVTEALRDNKMTVEQVKEVTRHESLDVLIRYRREIQGFDNSPVHALVTALALGDD